MPQTHNLVEMAKSLGAPRSVVNSAMELNPEYLTTRYIDAANGVPADMYNDASARLHLRCAEVIRKWAVKSLK